MMIGYISRKGMSISALGQQYLEEIRKYKELVTVKKEKQEDFDLRSVFEKGFSQAASPILWEMNCICYLVLCSMIGYRNFRRKNIGDKE